MPARVYSNSSLLAYLDEALPVAQMTEIEAALRNDAILRERAAALLRNRDSAGNTVGDIWRRLRLSCPTRTQLGSYLLGACSPELADYVEFHTQQVGCRYCSANLEDLDRPAAEAESVQRRQKFFQSSAGYMKQRDD